MRVLVGPDGIAPRRLVQFPDLPGVDHLRHLSCSFWDIVPSTMATETELKTLTEYLARIPSINPNMGSGVFENGHWWVKFQIDIQHKLAWQVVQELGHVLNYMSLEERLPTLFMPVSPPPYMNGGPNEFLSWVIECKDKEFEPATCVEWLEGRLPRPVDDLKEWERVEK